MKSKKWLRPIGLGAALIVTAMSLSSCSSSEEKSSSQLKVVSNFYPIKYLVDVIGGDLVSNTSLTPDGAEPHDLTLDAKSIVLMNESDAVFYIGASFQPDVDAAVATLPRGVEAVDLALSPGVTILDAPADLGKESLDGGKDPHIWLMPTNMIAMGEKVAFTLSELAPENSEQFNSNFATLKASLSSLDLDLRDSLATCEKKILVTSHAAFQYLADAYGLKQLAITGISPDDQPDGKLLAEIADAAKGAGVTTVFFEDVLPADLSEAVAKAIGASTSLLSALEFTPEGSNDYLSMMRENLKNIQAGLNCR
jgi:zinc transport system substrate-binding protein